MLSRTTFIICLMLSSLCLSAATMDKIEHATHEHTGMSNIPLSVCRSTGFCTDFQSMDKMMERMMSQLTNQAKPSTLAVRGDGLEVVPPNSKGDPLLGEILRNFGHSPQTVSSNMKGDPGPPRLILSPPPGNNRVPSSYYSDTSGPFIPGAFGLQDVIERAAPSNAKILPNAGCGLYDYVVELTNTDPNGAIYPSCVTVKRCGGCSQHPALVCRPNATERIQVMVTKFVYNGDMTLTNITYIKVKNHTSCHEECRVIESDCDKSIQIYDAANCECRCKDTDGPSSCTIGKLWDRKTCSCQCEQSQDCGDKFVFDSNTCRCVAGIERSGSNYVLGLNDALGGADRIPTSELPLTLQTTIDPCGHKSCPRNYRAVISGGRCRCRYALTRSASSSSRTNL